MKSVTSLSATDLIQARSSWRSCTGQAISTHTLELLKSYVQSKTVGIKGDKLRFELVAAQDGDAEELKGLGTYGFIRGASGFVIGAIDRETNNLEDYGYLMEDIILYATSLNLATCWLGGTFRKDNFSARISIQEHEYVPAVVSVGIPADKRNFVDRIIRNVAGSKRRLPWDSLFFESDLSTPLSQEKAGEFAHVLEMVRMSPSASNKQPWRNALDADSIHLYLQRTPGYRKKNWFSDLQRIDMGISMYHFYSVCKERNIDGRWVNKELRGSQPDDWQYIISWDKKELL
ncbi:MAG: nitroreductase family protein [Candidatus Marinimicrobia bacterium]|nr:nitroreductase family protein [Candidatus Neomarinimicrobiota bacterium]